MSPSLFDSTDLKNDLSVPQVTLRVLHVPAMQHAHSYLWSPMICCCDETRGRTFILLLETTSKLGLPNLLFVVVYYSNHTAHLGFLGFDSG